MVKVWAEGRGILMTKQRLPVGVCTRCGKPTREVEAINQRCANQAFLFTRRERCKGLVRSAVGEHDWAECAGCGGTGVSGSGARCGQCGGEAGCLADDPQMSLASILCSRMCPVSSSVLHSLPSAVRMIVPPRAPALIQTI